MENILKNNSWMETIQEHVSTIKMSESLEDVVHKSIGIMVDTLKSGGKIIFAGNGGSAADAQHLTAEFIGRFKRERPSLPSIALTVDSSILTCIGNDYGFDSIFSRQIQGIGNMNDTFVAITTSGNSANIINAVREANRRGIKTLCLTGKDGGKIKGLADIDIIVPSNVTARIQETHILIGHYFCEQIENKLGYE